LHSEHPNPLYIQVKTAIEEKIVSGEYKPNDKIPSESQLCQQYNISRITARQAVAELVKSGKLVRIQGRGTFVTTSPINFPKYHLMGFAAEMRQQGFIPGSKILEFKVIAPSLKIANYLSLDASEAVIRLKRLRTLNGHIISFEDTYFPFKMLPNLLEEDFERNSLYDTLIAKFNLVPTRAAMAVEAINCTEEMSKLVQSKPNSPLLHITSFAYDQNDRLFEYQDTYYRGESYIFHTEVNEHQSYRMLYEKKEEDFIENNKE